MGQQPNGYLRRLSMSLPEPLVLDVQELTLKMRRSGHRVSFSAFVEVALREMMSHDNVISVMRKHGAGARRHLDGQANGKPLAKTL
ncbi:MAG: hypothetical protein JO219_07075 [Candidatus Eremiobacteraeota bacterium]|nr:hypothetical protein [Candidatus Eremiobacteraeota bacterium]MBV8364859.1 hypothetical protein [Candidatus Eremiobacteraeota bacterium]